MTQKVLVDAEALKQLLQACIGPEHLIRELQFTRNVDPVGTGGRPNLNPINVLLDEYSLAARRNFEPQSRHVGRWEDTGRIGDFGLRVQLEADDKVVLVACDEIECRRVAVEFCAGPTDAASPNTRAALIALMVAMEQDNQAHPEKQWLPDQ